METAWSASLPEGVSQYRIDGKMHSLVRHQHLEKALGDSRPGVSGVSALQGSFGSPRIFPTLLEFLEFLESF